MKKKDLHNIKNTGFKTPNHYFEGLEDEILGKIKLGKKVECTGMEVPDNYFEGVEDAILSQIKLNENIKTPGFTTPETYFDTLDDTILNKVSSKKGSKVITLFNKKTILYVASTAAAIALFFNLNSSGKAVTFDSLDTEVVDNYILNETEFTDLASLFIEAELNETSFIDYNLSDDTLDSYLEDLEDNELISE